MAREMDTGNLHGLTARVRPAEGLRVRWPWSPRYLDPAGEVVPLDDYWRRRVAAGEVVVVALDPEPEQEE